ncbi:MAG: UDP-N-acetylenolpyruvoylglucosamine reductase [Candidatus Magasanikbacteria bacterium RIFCSPHIGHO2_02_FULL_47_14]|uniref:UDP-N-acetylenolpyruvoylglucosamine reductase n=1 Tax=Candidatus Magasanikbacteria bacterium RIFCSPHIGHO2_02_FULL_47_14 TaxID=1798680 RepID=A0A1F6M401_9BACT|nr:MAG: UDP-N-acetylenolpyruvoylglucosamine reductase [Candidatus Magasanikbacteria bacterium RIFCSPHIGHO2_02_FULL_47_14]
MYQQLKEFGAVKVNEPLAKHTTFKIGGPADFFVTVSTTADLVELLKFLDAEGMAYFILGGGSNMLVRDQGFQGVVVNIQTDQINISDTDVVADAGVVTVHLAQETVKAGLNGFEWGVGVPGTIGGAVRGNAGAMGGEMKDVISSVDVYRDGEVVTFSYDDCEFDYRHSIFKNQPGVVLRAHLRLKKTEDIAGKKKMIEFLQYRNKTQPQGFASTGCIFKNVEFVPGKQQFAFDVPEEFIKKGKISAGWLVEKAGMKGAQVGQAQVSPVHGNFVVNLGGASAHDVLTLVEQIKEKVYDTSGIELHEEIQII